MVREGDARLDREMAALTSGPYAGRPKPAGTRERMSVGTWNLLTMQSLAERPKPSISLSRIWTDRTTMSTPIECNPVAKDQL